jgi:hypothetical protein
MSPHRHALLTIRNLTPGNTDRRFKHERDYSEENGFPRNSQGSTREKNSDQRKFEENLDYPSVDPRTSARLLRERKQVGVCRRGVVLCDNRGDLSLANLGSRRRIAGIFPGRIELRSREPVGDIRASLTPCFWWVEAYAGQNAEAVSRSLGGDTFLKQGVKEATRKSRQQAHRV